MCFRHRLLGGQVIAPYRGGRKPPLEVVVMTESIDDIDDITEINRNTKHRMNVTFMRCNKVGATGFEPAAPCSQSRCATKLRYAPIDLTILSHIGKKVKP